MIQNLRHAGGNLVAGGILTATLILFTLSAPPRLQADTAASSDGGKTVGGFFGAWKNTDPRSKACQRILIGEKAGQVYMDCWDKEGSEGLIIRPRVYIPFSPSELSAKKTFSLTQDGGFDTIDYTVTLDGGKVVLYQKYTFSDPKRGAIEDTATYTPESAADAPRVKGLLGAWRNISKETQWNRNLVIYEEGGKVFLHYSGLPVELAITPDQASTDECEPITVKNDFSAFAETLTLTLKDKVLTVDVKDVYSKSGSSRAFTEEFCPAE